SATRFVRFPGAQSCLPCSLIKAGQMGDYQQIFVKPHCLKQSSSLRPWPLPRIRGQTCATTGQRSLLHMKNIFLVVSVLILPLISVRAGDEDDVLRAERELALCYQNSDAACIEQGVMEDYTLTNSKGKITTRADDLTEARKHDPKYEIFENHDMKVRVHDDAAVVTGITHAKGISGGQPFDAEFRFTDTFVKDHGRWRLWAGQAVKITP